MGDQVAVHVLHVDRLADAVSGQGPGITAIGGVHLVDHVGDADGDGVALSLSQRQTRGHAHGQDQGKQENQ